jgi:hypothetical protein
MRRFVVGLSAILLLPTPAWSQLDDCFPSKNSNEAQLFAAFSVPLAYSIAEAPEEVRPGEVRAGLEATYLPNIDEEIRTPTTCRPGKGPETTDLLFALPRPRVSVSLPGGLVLQASWVPPVPLNGVKANLVGASLQRGFQVSRKTPLVTLRAHGTFGLIRAPITCGDQALQDPSSVCFQGTRSDDHYHPNIFGLEGTLSWSLGDGRIRPFLGGGVNVLHPRFQVNFTDQFGVPDNRKVEVDLTRGALFGGATWAPASKITLSGQIYASPGDAVTGRVMASYTLRS